MICSGRSQIGDRGSATYVYVYNTRMYVMVSVVVRYANVVVMVVSWESQGFLRW